MNNQRKEAKFIKDELESVKDELESVKKIQARADETINKIVVKLETLENKLNNEKNRIHKIQMLKRQESIQAAVCKYFKISEDDFYGNKRSVYKTDARIVFVFIMQNDYGYTNTELCKILNIDQSSICYYKKSIGSRAATKHLWAAILTIRDELQEEEEGGQNEQT